MDTQIEKFLANMFEEKRNNLFCDVTLVAAADGTRIPAHRVVLYAASEYFQKLLTTALKEMNASEIALGGVAGAVLEQLIEFCYTQKITIDASNAVDILAAAHLFRFVEVVEMCEKVCVDSVDVTNALGLLAIANQYDLIALQKRAQAFVHQQFLEFTENDEYLRLDAERVVDLLESDNIEVHSEEEVYNAIVKWIDVDRDARKRQYASLMKCLRLSKIELHFLHGRIKTVSEELNMTHVFEEACEAKCHEVAPDAERKLLPNYMIAIGSASLGSRYETQMNRYSIATDTWEPFLTIARMYMPQFHNIDNCLYFIHRISENSIRISCMSLGAMQLETRKAPNLKYNRNGFISAADEQYIYLMSWCDNDWDDWAETAKRYDTKNDNWVTIHGLNRRRIGARATVLNGKVYVVGGVSPFDSRHHDLRSVERYDPETNRWTEVAPLNVERRDHGCCIVRDSIYVVGGGDVTSIEKYDAQIDQWTIIPIQHYGCSTRFGISVSGDWIYIAGGLAKLISREVQRINVFDSRIEDLAEVNYMLCMQCVMTR